MKGISVSQSVHLLACFLALLLIGSVGGNTEGSSIPSSFILFEIYGDQMKFQKEFSGCTILGPNEVKKKLGQLPEPSSPNQIQLMTLHEYRLPSNECVGYEIRSTKFLVMTPVKCLSNEGSVQNFGQKNASTLFYAHVPLTSSSSHYNLGLMEKNPLQNEDSCSILIRMNEEIITIKGPFLFQKYTLVLYFPLTDDDLEDENCVDEVSARSNLLFITDNSKCNETKYNPLIHENVD